MQELYKLTRENTEKIDKVGERVNTLEHKIEDLGEYMVSNFKEMEHRLSDKFETMWKDSRKRTLMGIIMPIGCILWTLIVVYLVY